MEMNPNINFNNSVKLQTIPNNISGVIGLHFAAKHAWKNCIVNI